MSLIPYTDFCDAVVENNRLARANGENLSLWNPGSIEEWDRMPMTSQDNAMWKLQENISRMKEKAKRDKPDSQVEAW